MTALETAVLYYDAWMNRRGEVIYDGEALRRAMAQAAG